MITQLLSLWLIITKVEVEVSTFTFKYLAIIKRVKDKKVVIQHISIGLMIVDPLTRGMPPFKLKDHVERMGLGSTL